MPRVLHLIKDPSNRVVFDVLAQQARDPGLALSVVLLQQAVDLRDPLPGEVFRLAEGSSKTSPYPAIDHARLLDLIFSADTVVTW